MVSKGDDKTGLAIMAFGTIGKLEGALQCDTAAPGAAQCNTLKCHCGVQQLQLLMLACVACCQQGQFPIMERILPEPNERTQQDQQQKTGGPHQILPDKRVPKA